MKYYLTYSLGFKDKTNKAAVKGTVMHRTLQCLADKVLAIQSGKKTVDFEGKRIKLDKCDDIEYISQLSFDYYTPMNPELVFTKKDFKDCVDWVNLAISYNKGSLDPRNQNIFATEQFFDFEVKEDWAKYSYDINGEKISGYLGIKGTIDLILAENNGFYQVLDYKGLPVDTPIPTPKGWTNMGDLKIGDFVFDRFGKPTRIIGQSQKIFKECFEIEFDDTSKVICDNEHQWKLSNGETVSIQDLKIKDLISVTKPIDCEEVDLPIDPYVLGLWLGDGRNRSFEITSADSFIFDEIERRGYKLGVNQEKRVSKCSSRVVLGMTKQLRELNLLHNKHIPMIYLRSSYTQRLDLLRGLMDSDGSVNKIRKQCIFMNCNETLSQNVKELLLTLGQRPLLSKTIAKGFGLVVNAYPVSFRPLEINPFLLPLKRERVDVSWGGGSSLNRRVVKITPIGKKLTQCIMVESSDSTYLCTSNMIPTHNSGQRKNWATGKKKEYADLEYDSQLLLYYYALKNLFPDKEFIVSIFYINDGGIYEFPFDRDHYLAAENMLKQKFMYIKNVQLPRQVSTNPEHPTCKYMCAFSKSVEGSDKSICQHFYDEIKKKGIQEVTNENINLKAVNSYTGGGRVDQ